MNACMIIVSLALLNTGLVAADVTLQPASEQQFNAVVIDQFGNAMADKRHSFAWTADGGTLNTTSGPQVTYIASSVGDYVLSVSCESWSVVTVLPSAKAVKVVVVMRWCVHRGGWSGGHGGRALHRPQR